MNGKFHGEGLYKWDDNQYFKGTYNNGLKEGKGEIGYDDGKNVLLILKMENRMEKEF